MSSNPISLGRVPGEPSSVRVVEADGGDPLERAIERLRDEAHAEGLATGIARANSEAAQALSLAAERLAARVEEVEPSMARTAVELAVQIAQDLICVEIEQGRHDLERIVRETLQASGVGRQACTVHLNPGDAAQIADVPFRAGTEIVADVEVARGDVHVETSNGLFVRDMKDALASISERILESLR